MAEALQRLQDALSGRYAFTRELGLGGTATLYLAEDLKHHRPVAIKVLDPELAASIGPGSYAHPRCGAMPVDRAAQRRRYSPRA